MARALACLAMLAALLGCAPKQTGPVQITLQRFFGACDAEYGNSTDVAAAEGECGIVTTLINKFNAENPDIHVKVNVVYWPGYDQLSAELAAGDPPDLVTMHQSVISDYAQRRLIMPLDEGLRSVGVIAGGLHARRARGRDAERPRLCAAFRQLGAALADQHEPVPRRRSGARRQAGAAAQPRRAAGPGAPVQARHRQALSPAIDGQRAGGLCAQSVHVPAAAERSDSSPIRTTSG